MERILRRLGQEPGEATLSGLTNPSGAHVRAALPAAGRAGDAKANGRLFFAVGLVLAVGMASAALYLIRPAKPRAAPAVPVAAESILVPTAPAPAGAAPTPTSAPSSAPAEAPPSAAASAPQVTVGAPAAPVSAASTGAPHLHGKLIPPAHTAAPLAPHASPGVAAAPVRGSLRQRPTVRT